VEGLGNDQWVRLLLGALDDYPLGITILGMTFKPYTL
jgi:hypothetical protein